MPVSVVFAYLNPQTCLVVGFVFLLAYWYLRTQAPKNLPPGPWALPGLGNVGRIFVTKYFHLAWTELRQQYGPVVCVQVGSERIIVLNSYSAIHEAFVKKGEDFSGRPAWDTVKLLGALDNGIVLLRYGPFWKQQRTFTIMGLRDFGFGKRSLEGKVAEESQGLRKEILKKGQKPFNPRLMLQNAVGNVICSIVLGKRFEYADEKFAKIMQAFDEYFGDQWLSSLGDFFPLARHLPNVKTATAQRVKNVEFTLGVMREDIAAHKETFDPYNIRDLIDTFLLEMKKREGEREDGNGFTDRQLDYLIVDLFIGGTETTSGTLNWILLYMLRHPHVQEKVHQEIDSTIGQNVAPSLSHRSQLPYTEAVIAEVMRINPIASTGAPHCTSDNTTLFGYDIPKDTTVFPNLWAVLHDPEVYPEPHVFKPERFLDDNGQFKKGKTFIPFSAGRRSCPGEQLARMELFLFFTSLLQHFSFKLPEGAPLPSAQGNSGFTNHAEDYHLHAVPRE